MSERRLSGLSSRPSSGKTQRDMDSYHSSTAKLSNKKHTTGNSSDRDHETIDESLVLECKAAYISVVKGSSIDKPLTSRSELLLALQNTGRNPTQRTLSKYWTKSTDEVGFDEFCGICKKEAVTTSDDLMKAFKKIDINGDGFISHSELKKVMTTKGEKMTDEEVSRLIDEVDENKDGKLDYMEFSNMVLNTSKQCKETAARRYEKRKTSKDTSKSQQNGRKSSINGEHTTLSSREHTTLSSREHNTSSSREHNTSSSRENTTPSSREHTSSVRERRNSSAERGESKRNVPRSPRISPRVAKDKFGSQTSLRSHESRNVTGGKAAGLSAHAPMPKPRGSSNERRLNETSTEESPKPAPRRMSRQETIKPAVSSLNLKLQTPKKLADWRHLKRRGMFYVEDNGDITSSQYTLVITKSTSVWISISPSPSQSTAECDTPLDMCVLIVRSKPDKSGNSLVTFTEKRDTTGKFGVRCDLEPGKYFLLAYSSGCGLPLSKPSTDPQKKLIKQKTGTGDQQVTLTKEFKYVLTDIFNMVDTDMNGTLSREEFCQYSVRTGEEEVGDDEWDVVKENAELKRGELTCKGFIRLIELEAEDAEGDADDLWVALESLGYDSTLTQNQAYPFTLEVSLENDDASTLLVQPSFLTTKSRSLQMALKEAYISKGEPLSADHRCRAAKTSGSDRDVRIYCFETDTMAAIVIENKLHSRVTVKLDCTGSKNVKPSAKSLSQVCVLPGNASTVALQLVPKDENKDWFVSCVEKDLLTAA